MRFALPCRHEAAAGVQAWFSEFTDLTTAPSGRMEYGPGPARFFEEQRQTPERLRELSQHQCDMLANGLGAELPSLSATGGFLH